MQRTSVAKCKFANATVMFLGRVVGQGKVGPVDVKVAADSGFPHQTTKKEIQRFQA